MKHPQHFDPFRRTESGAARSCTRPASNRDRSPSKKEDRAIERATRCRILSITRKFPGLPFASKYFSRMPSGSRDNSSCGYRPASMTWANWPVLLHVGGIDAKIVEGEMSHALGKQNGQRVGLLPHGHAGIPDAGMVSARQAGEAVFHSPLQHLLVSKKERESQSESLLHPGANAVDSKCRSLRCSALHEHTAILETAMSTVRSVSRTSSSRSFSL